MSSAPGGESAAGEHLKADPRRDERDFVTANFREKLGFSEVQPPNILRHQDRRSGSSVNGRSVAS